MPATARTNIRRRRCSTPSRSASAGAISPGCTSRSSATFCSAASRARTSALYSSSARASRSSVQARSFRASFEKLGAEVSHKIEDVLPTADVVNLLRIQHERQRKRIFSRARRIHPLVRSNERTRETFEARLPDHASRADQPRGRDRQRSRGWLSQRDSGSGHQRPRRAHGGSLPMRRNREVRTLAIAHLGSALILSAGDRILRSRTFSSGQQSDIAAKSDKHSSPQNAATSTLQACAPQT